MKKLKLQKREVLGKKVKQLRNEGFTPAVVYNSKGDSKNVSIGTSDADWLYRNATSTSIIDTELDKKTFKTLVKEFDVDPVTDSIYHIALFEIDENAPMTFTIPFHMVGVAPAVKNNLGVLVNVLDSIDVRCQLSKLQPNIEIDISKLEHPGQNINVEDIQLPEGMSLINEDLSNATIVTITDVQKIEEVIVEEEEEGEEIEGGEGEEVAEGEEGEKKDETEEHTKDKKED